MSVPSGSRGEGNAPLAAGLDDLGAPPEPTTFSLRSLQIAALRELISPPARRGGGGGLAALSGAGSGSSSSSGSETSPWKVLVLDAFCREMVAPLLRVGDLRRLGVTLHLSIDSARDRVPGAPAVYLVRPTEGNAKKIGEDLSRALYDSCAVHFATPSPRSVLEGLASGALSSGSVPRVTRVVDEYLGYVALEPRLFTLAAKNCFARAFADNARDEDVEAAVAEAASGVVCAALTLGAVPVIRAPRGGAAEMVAREAARRIADHVASGGVPLGSSGTRRPLLVVVDRNVDLAVPLHHSWVYQALLHDVVGVRSNRVTLDISDDDDGGGGGGGVRTKTYDLEEGDPFWRATRHLPFPEVTTRADEALRSYREASEDVYRRTGASVAADGTVTSTDSVGAAGLASAVMLLPKLTERKRLLDMHMNVATALMRSIKDRELNEYFSLEEALMSTGTCDRGEILERLGPAGRGTPADKLRLLLIYFASATRAPAADLAECERAARESGCDLTALDHLRKAREHARAYAADAGAAGGGPGYPGSAAGGGSGAGAGSDADPSSLLNIAKGVWGQSKEALKDATAAARKWLPVDRSPPLVRIVAQLVDGAARGPAQDYCYFDPKSTAADMGDGARGSRGPGSSGAAGSGADSGPGGAAGGASYKEAMVFVFGGGSYLEHRELQNYAAERKEDLAVIYGADEILSPVGFVDQLGQCGGARPGAASGQAAPGDEDPGGIL